MRRIQAAVFLIVFTVTALYASERSVSLPDTARSNNEATDTNNITSEILDSGTIDSIATNPPAAEIITITTTGKPEDKIPPETEIESSPYIKFSEHSVQYQEEKLIFEGNFVVLGKAVFGHFDFVLLKNTGAVISAVKTDNRSYRSDKGGRVKTVQVNLGSASGCTLIKVYFHETRIEPDIGACISK
jgi:hypothetical protein